jgi:hypothetical protein
VQDGLNIDTNEFDITNQVEESNKKYIIINAIKQINILRNL